jgi:hypothetical protein
MRRIIEFPVPDGGVLLVEVDEPEGAGPRPAGTGEGAIERATMGLDQAISKVRPLAEQLLTQLRGLTRRPDQVTVEFGIKLNVTAGIVIANTAVEGNCKVSLSWKQTD